MQSPADAALLDAVRAIAERAGSAIMEIYASGFDVDHKADDSPLTQADLASHAVIVAGLAALEPALPVLSEESSAADIDARRQWERYWLVDPLDGTKEFIKRNGEFTVNIALIDGHVPVLGVVLAPALGRLYMGMADRGAWMALTGESPRPIGVRTRAEAPIRVVGSRSHPSPDLAAYVERLGEHEIKPMGSSLKICLVAAGEADVYPRFGPTSEWDTAAAQAILEAAGGGMIDPEGRPLRYNLKDSLLNPHFIAFGDKTRDWSLRTRGS